MLSRYEMSGTEGIASGSAGTGIHSQAFEEVSLPSFKIGPPPLRGGMVSPPKAKAKRAGWVD